MTSAFKRTGKLVEFQRVSNPRQFALEVIETIKEDKSNYNQDDWDSCFSAYALIHLGGKNNSNFAMGTAIAKVLGLTYWDAFEQFFHYELTLTQLTYNARKLPTH